MTRISWYVFSQFAVVFLGSLCLFYIIFTLIKLSDVLQTMIRHSDRLNLPEMFLYFIYDYPLLGLYFMPICGLFAIVFVLSKINAQNESIAIYNSGVSVVKIVSPMIIFGMIVSFLVALGEDSVIYRLHHKQRDLHNRLFNRIPMDKWNRYQLTAFGAHNKIYFIGRYSPSEASFTNTKILYLNDDLKTIKKLVSFNEAFYNQSNKKWAARNVVERYWEDNRLKSVNFLGNIDLDLNETPEAFKNQQETNPHLSAKELRVEIEKKKIIGGSFIEDFSDMYYKYGSYFIFPFILFLGVPVSTVSRRATFIVSLLLVLVIVIIYFIVSYVGNSLGREGILNPMVSGWISNIISLTFGVYYWKKKRLI